MTQERVRFRDREIAVRTEGRGPAIVFCHGNSCSSRAFEKQMESNLRQRFRLVAVDLPGHGDSERGAHPELTCTLPGYAEAIGAVVEALQLEGAVFVGWSLGGHVLLEAVDHLPRASGFLIFGAPPVASIAQFATVTSADPAIQAAFRAESTDDEARALVALFMRPGASIPELFFEDFRRTDPNARVSLAASLARGEMKDEVAIAASMRQPLAIVHGAEELVVLKRAWFDELEAPSLWRGRVQDIPNAGHAPHWETPDIFNGILAAFATDCFGRVQR